MLTLEVQKILAHLTDPVIFEFGACDGIDSEVIYKACAVKPLYYAFEPDPRNQKLVVRAQKLGINVVLGAIGHVTARMPFYLASAFPLNGSYGSSSLSPFRDQTKDFSWCKLDATVEVDCYRLDDFCALPDVNVSRIDFIWADIQGGERFMIEGAQQMLKKTRWLYTEYEGEDKEHEGTAYEHSSSLQRILELLPNWSVVKSYGQDALLTNNQYEGPA